MADEKEQLTPEEKLLKVIQEGDEEETKGEAATAETVEAETPAMQPTHVPEPTSADIAAAAADKTAATEGDAAVAEVVKEPVAETPKKSKLKLAGKGEAAKEAAGDQPEKGEDDEESEDGVIGAGPVASPKGAPGGVLGIGVVNKCLVGVVLIMVGFAVYEIWAGIQTLEARPADTPAVPEYTWLMPPAEGEAEMPIDQVLKAFEEKSIIGVPQVAQGTGDAPPPPDVTTAVEVYARKNLNLIGLSDDEAIVVDVKEDKMHFLKVGDTLTIGQKEVDVGEVAGEYIVLREGEKEIRVE